MSIVAIVVCSSSNSGISELVCLSACLSVKRRDPEGESRVAISRKALCSRQKMGRGDRNRLGLVPGRRQR